MWRLICCLVACHVFVHPTSTFAASQAAQAFARAVEAMDAGDWAASDGILPDIPNASAKIYHDWRRLRAGEAEWQEYRAFVQEHPDWPGLPLLRKTGERKIPKGRPSKEIMAFFLGALPQTGTGTIRLADALIAEGKTEAANDAIKLAWLSINLTQEERETIARRFKSAVAAHHFARADTMVWNGQFSQALALKPYLSAAQNRLVETRIALRRGKNGVNKMIDGLSGKMRKAPGLAYDRFRWRLRKDLWDSAAELMIATSTSRAALGRPDVWSDRRRVLARWAMRDGDYKTAYALASKHFLDPDESGYIDLEWLSGYLKLVYLKDAEAAVTHFRRLRTLGVTPITQGRVWYWLGRAHEASGNAEKAQEAFGVAARYQTSFYGQMAAERAGLPVDQSLTGTSGAPSDAAPFQGSSVFQAAEILRLSGQHYDAGRFYAHMAESMDEAQQARLGRYLADLDAPNMALRVAKNAARMGRVVIDSYYPVTDLAKLADGVPPELVMAVARQESELNQNVESPAGAQGLMQVMPRTAREVARRIGVTYSGEKLREDWEYNAKIGIAYLQQMLRRYDGSYVLAAAAYNAGPHRADRWIREHGDPRKASTNTEQWIEKIQFRETRNYVQRVLESVQVYRARLTGDAKSVRLNSDLKRGS